jgi:hypothetical protein
MEIFNYVCLVTPAFSQTRHIATSVKLFVPNGLTECNNPFLLDVSVVQSWCWLISGCDVTDNSTWFGLATGFIHHGDL